MIESSKIPPKPNLLTMSASAPPELDVTPAYEQEMAGWRQKIADLGITEKEVELQLAKEDYDRRVSEIEAQFPD